MTKRFKIGLAIVVLGVAVLGLTVAKPIWTPDTMGRVVRRMAQYQKGGHFDEAIGAGKRWVSNHPEDGMNDQVFGRIADAYLGKAKTDEHRRDEYVSDAILYRDKMLPVALDRRFGWYSIDALSDAASISEQAGDLSPNRQCQEYQNAMKLIKQSEYSLREKQNLFSRGGSSGQDRFGYTTADAEERFKASQRIESRIDEKKRAVNCTKELP